MNLPSDFDIGQAAMDAIIEGGMIHADREEPRVLIWNGNAQEQLGAAIRAAIETPDADSLP